TFTETTIFTLTPVQANPSTAYVLDLNDPNHPEFAALTNPALAQHFDQLGAVRVDLDPPDAVAQRQFDVSVPAPANATLSDQFFATRVVSFRDYPDGFPRYELTAIDLAHLDQAHGVVVTDPVPTTVFPGLKIGGTFGLHRALECLGLISGWVSIGDYFGDKGGFVGGDSGPGGLLPFPIDQSAPQQFQLLVPCNQPVVVK